MEGGETLTAGEVFAFAQAFTAIVRRHVTDPVVLRAIAEDVRRLPVPARGKVTTATVGNARVR
jgi:hypothetical protein